MSEMALASRGVGKEMIYHVIHSEPFGVASSAAAQLLRPGGGRK